MSDIAVPGLTHRAFLLDMEGWVGISWRVGTAYVWGQAEVLTAAGCCPFQAAAGWLRQQLPGWDWERMRRKLESMAAVEQEYQLLGEETLDLS